MYSSHMQIMPIEAGTCIKEHSDRSYIKVGAIREQALLFTNTNGHLLFAGALPYIANSIEGIEAWAIRCGLLHCKRLNHRRIRCDTDSSILPDIIMKQSKCPWRIHNIMLDIWNLINYFELFEIRHIYSQSNRATDFLAKSDRLLSKDAFWTHDHFIWTL